MLQRILLFAFLSVSFAAMAGKNCVSQVSKHVTTTKAFHHFSDATDQHGEIEIYAVNHAVSFHRQHLKTGHDTFLSNYNEYFTYTAQSQQQIQFSPESRGSFHLQLIFPFHYFW